METGKKRGNKTTPNLAKPVEIKKITLNDGKEYDLAPVDINLLAEVEDKFEQSFIKIFEGGHIKPIRFLLYLRLKDKYPEIDSEEKLGSMIDLDTLVNIGETLVYL